MNDRAVTPLAVLVAVVSAACGTYQVPAGAAPRPDRCDTAGYFRAGFGRADITPPPGLGLQGLGPEGRAARGYRQRLYARALVLEDEIGERVALVAVDLPQVSTILHREAGDRLSAAGVCLGTDRLMLSATHTHAGPGHFFTAQLINDAGSSVPGFSTDVVRFLVDGMVAAVEHAVADLARARAGWGSTNIWGFTRNRSYEAFRRNRPRPDLREPPANLQAGLEDVHVAIDPQMTMLRVDRVAPNGTATPLGAFSVFAIHATGNAVYNELFDGDIPGRIERGLERHIDRMAGHDPTEAGPPRSFHLVANGTEGDVSPDWPEIRQRPLCPAPTLQRRRPISGPRVPPGPLGWVYPDRPVQDFCIGFSRDFVNVAGDSLSQRAIDLWTDIGRGVMGSLDVRRAFAAVDVRANADALGICGQPRQGTAVIGGGADGRTRYHQWRVFGLWSAGFDENGVGIDHGNEACHNPKRITAGTFLQGVIVGREGLPRLAQFQVFRIGGMLVGAVPWEVTTTAGLRIKDAMRNGAGQGHDAVLVGLSNGYFQYLTTPEEYAQQRYEGGSNIYGPGTQRMVAMEMNRLAAATGTGGVVTGVDVFDASPGGSKRLLPRPNPSRTLPTRTIETPRVSADTVTIRWRDAYPGDLTPADGALLEIREENGTFVTWDDDSRLEVWAIGASGNSYTWEVRWTGCVPGRRYRLHLVVRPWRSQTLPAGESDVFVCS